MSNSAQKLVVAELLVRVTRIIHQLLVDGIEPGGEISADGDTEKVMRVVFNLIDSGKEDDDIAVWLTTYKGSLGGVPVEMLSGAGAGSVIEYSQQILDESSP